MFWTSSDYQRAQSMITPLWKLLNLQLLPKLLIMKNANPITIGSVAKIYLAIGRPTRIEVAGRMFRLSEYLRYLVMPTHIKKLAKPNIRSMFPLLCLISLGNSRIITYIECRTLAMIMINDHSSTIWSLWLNGIWLHVLIDCAFFTKSVYKMLLVNFNLLLVSYIGSSLISSMIE